MARYFLAFFVALVFSFALTPLIRTFAVWANIFDLPSDRKIHKKPVPLLGGFPIFLAFNLTAILGIIFNQSILKEAVISRWQALLVCQIIILGLGFIDDMVHLKPGVKFLFQVSVGILIVLFGFGIKDIANPFHGGIIHLGLLSFPLTILWVVMITNALNLIDGLDGLAAGTALIASIAIFGISYFNSNEGVAIISMILAGSILGFLRYNFFPAKIFLGDSGSLLLGFLLSILSIQGSSKGATVVALMAPILALGLPIMDTLLSMIRRFLRSIHVIDYSTQEGHTRILFLRKFKIFTADKDHVHHRLLKLGFSQRKAVILLYGVCVGLSALALLSFAAKNIHIIPFMGAILVAFFVAIKSLKYQEFKILENGLLIPIFNFPIVQHRIFVAFIDLAMISLSTYLSFVLVFRGLSSPVRNLFVHSLPVFLLITVVIFYLSGLYKISLSQAGLEEFVSISSAVLLSALASTFIGSLIFKMETFGGPAFFVLNFYLLLTFAGGFRASYRILNSYYQKSFSDRGKKVLIYGAGNRGSSVLKEIRRNGSYMFSPVGFIDDDPKKRRRNLHGCPILGSFEDLGGISEKAEISEIIISTEKIGKERKNRLIEFCRTRGIILRQYEFRFYEFS